MRGERRRHRRIAPFLGFAPSYLGFAHPISYETTMVNGVDLSIDRGFVINRAADIRPTFEV